MCLIAPVQVTSCSRPAVIQGREDRRSCLFAVTSPHNLSLRSAPLLPFLIRSTMSLPTDGLCDVSFRAVPPFTASRSDSISSTSPSLPLPTPPLCLLAYPPQSGHNLRAVADSEHSKVEGCGDGLNAVSVSERMKYVAWSKSCRGTPALKTAEWSGFQN